MCRDTNLLEDQDLISLLQVLQLVGDQDPGLVLQQATDAPDPRTQRKGDVRTTHMWLHVSASVVLWSSVHI